jgi:hypothetical protein
MLCKSAKADQQRPRVKEKSQQEDNMDAFFIIPIILLLALLAWCILQLKDGL